MTPVYYSINIIYLDIRYESRYRLGVSILMDTPRHDDRLESWKPSIAFTTDRLPSRRKWISRLKVVQLHTSSDVYIWSYIYTKKIYLTWLQYIVLCILHICCVRRTTFWSKFCQIRLLAKSTGLKFASGTTACCEWTCQTTYYYYKTNLVSYWKSDLIFLLYTILNKLVV